MLIEEGACLIRSYFNNINLYTYFHVHRCVFLCNFTIGNCTYFNISYIFPFFIILSDAMLINVTFYWGGDGG